MRLVICGGRDYQPATKDYDVLMALLRYLNPEVVIHGGASGVDQWAGQRAEYAGFHVEVHRPDYANAPGSSAPLLRNTHMARRAGEGGVCIAFPGGSGTAHMVGQAEKYGLRVIDLRG